MHKENLEKLQENIQNDINNGKYYDAQQNIKIIYHRSFFKKKFNTFF